MNVLNAMYKHYDITLKYDDDYNIIELNIKLSHTYNDDIICNNYDDMIDGFCDTIIEIIDNYLK